MPQTVFVKEISFIPNDGGGHVLTLIKDRVICKTLMFGLGTGEIILVLALALIFIGPEKLPQIATALGKIVRQIRRAVDEIKDDLKNE